MREGPPAVLAALHRGDVPAIEADQQDQGRGRVTSGTQLDLRLAVIESERDRHFLAVTSRKVERMLDIGTVRADCLPPAVDDNLRCVDGGKIQKRSVMLLALGRLTAGEGILPAQPIPVIDMKRQCQQTGTAREFGKQRVGRRTGRATLGVKSSTKTGRSPARAAVMPTVRQSDSRSRKILIMPSRYTKAPTVDFNSA
jgi:hypothetical protein